MTGVMDHSNLRPAGLSIQASKLSGFGDVGGDTVISVRDDSFAAVADQVVEHFSSADGAFDEDGACKKATGACEWNDGQGEELTDESGNIVTDGGADRGDTNVYYAWIGSEDEEEFDVDDTDHVSVSVVSMNEEQAMKVTTSINKNADGNAVDLDRGGSVTVTVQLVDTAVTAAEAQTDQELTEGAAAAGAKNVARAGIEISVGVMRSTNPNSDGTADRVVYNNTDVTTLTTDDDGKATFVVDAPEDDDDKGDQRIGADDGNDGTYDASANLENRDDTLTFTYKAVEGRMGSAAEAEITISWKEDDPVTTSASSSAPAYVVPDKDGDLAITASVTLHDQYGNGIREGGTGQMVEIQIGAEAVSPATDNATVNRNGTATRRKVIKKVRPADNPTGTVIAIAFDEEPSSTEAVTDIANDNEADDQSVQVVTNANDDDVGDAVVNALRGDDDEFLANDDAELDTGASNLVFSYDADDIFVNSVENGETTGELLTMEKFEDMLSGYDGDETGSLRAIVDVVIYNSDGSSIFKVTRAAGVPG